MNYTTVAKIYTKNKRTGFRLINERKEEINVTNEELIEIANNPDVKLDIKMCGRSWKFIDNSKSVLSLPIIRMDKSRASIKPSHSGNVEFFIGDSLDDMIKLTLGNQPVRICASIKDYMQNDQEGMVCTVAGLECTGKKTLIKSYLSNNEITEKTVWFNIVKRTKSDEVRQVYTKYCKRQKVLVIEGADNISDLHKAKWIADLAEHGHKVILIVHGDIFYKTYTNSVFRNKVYSVYTSNVGYCEYAAMNNKNVNQLSVLDYIGMGELNFNSGNSGEFNHVYDIRYFDNHEDVLTDLVKAVAPNDTALRWFGLKGSHSDMVKTLRSQLFIMIKNVVTSRLYRVHAREKMKLNFNGFNNVFDLEIASNYNKKMAEISKDIKVDNRAEFDSIEILNLAAILEQMKIMVRVENLFFKNYTGKDYGGISRYKYYFSNPAVVNRFVYMIYKEFDKYYIPRRISGVAGKAFLAGEAGLIYESAILSNICEIASKTGIPVYYYHDNEDREIDLITITNCDGTNRLQLCEIKSSLQACRVDNLKWIGDTCFIASIESKLHIKKNKYSCSHIVVYPGKSGEIEDNSNAFDCEVQAKNDTIFLSEMQKRYRLSNYTK